MHTWMPFLLFSIVISVTPGPTNVLVFAISSHHGWKAALPAVLGSVATVAMMLPLAGLGLDALLLRQPGLRATLPWGGVIWLSWLAWKIFEASPPAVGEIHGERERIRLGFLGAIGLQLVNPKAWIVAVTAATVFGGPSLSRAAHAFAMAELFFTVSLPCVGAWAALGAGTGRLIGSPRHLTYLNRGLALLLLASAWTALII